MMLEHRVLPDDLATLLILGRIPEARIIAEVQRDLPWNWRPAERAAILRLADKERISTYLTEPETCLGAKARDLFALLPKSNFWLNPRSECQKPLPAEEIALITNLSVPKT
jgi:hypothetical protein